jgi:signal transduction histidine kinase/PAS domain-containing protein
MFVWWGPQLINLYNDAYIPILGQRHPRAFGRPARETWEDIWRVVGPQAEAVMQRGEATWNERVLLVMERHGYTEDTWFTWSYSPIPDEQGGIGGLFCACTEETRIVLAERERDRLLERVETERARLAEAFAQSPAFVAVLHGPDLVFEFANKGYSRLVGGRDLIGRPVREALPELEGQGFFEVLQHVHDTGEPYVGRDTRVMVRRPPRDELEAITLDFVYQPMRSADGAVAGVLVHGVDVTEKTHTIQSLREAERSRQRVEDALAFEKRVLELIATGSPLPTVLETIVRAAESQSTDGMVCSILMLDEDGERLVHGAAPSLPAAYNEAIHGLSIGPQAGSCGTAAYERRPVEATDIATDPRWEPYRHLALPYGLASCSSTPIISSEGIVLGTVAIYYRTPRAPSPRDGELIRSATHLAGIVLEKELVDRRLRQSLEAEQAARTEAERASRMKDEFLATLSHELRSPLNAILGWTRIISLTPGVPAELARGVDVIERNASAQATIIQDLLDMSAIVSGKVRLSMASLDLAALLRVSVEAALPAAEAKQIRLRTSLDDDAGAEVMGDASRLQQVFWNLLTNAVKFTPREGGIEVSLRRVASSLEVRVADSGAGIAAEFLPYVFDRFRQGDATIARRHGGLGLGLSIVKQIVELHGGAVAASSAGPGQGATFVVTLPVAALRGPESAAQEEQHRLPFDTPRPPDEGDVSGLRLLVVDDDRDARDMVRRLLEERGAAVVTAGSVEEALAVLRAQRFDVLISDIGMPGEDGHTLIRRVRALGPEAGGDVPALALTAYVRPEDRAQAIRAGFQSHASKPLDPALLFSLVAGLAHR